jgi:hypothetical protein
MNRLARIGLALTVTTLGLTVAGCGFSGPFAARESTTRVVRARAEEPAVKAQLTTILSPSCASCHSFGRRSPVMFAKDGSLDLEGVRSNLGSIIRAIETGRMPRGNGPKVSPENLAVLKAWQAAGMPDAR